MKTDLTQKRALELFTYDEETGILTRKLKCGKTKPCGHKPVCRGYGTVGIDGKQYYTHRVIWLWWYGYWPDGEIDHKDQNPMNNRIENLRVVTRSGNRHNQGMHRSNTSGYTGVHWNKREKKYQSYIGVDGKLTHLGYFNAAEEAILAHMLAKINYHPDSPIAQEYLRELTYAA